MGSLEPLSITCTTCGRRLRVKDRRLIGQIVACPKCQGMVLIEDPERIRDPELTAPEMTEELESTATAEPLVGGEDTFDSGALTQEGLSPAGTEFGGETLPPPGWQDGANAADDANQGADGLGLPVGEVPVAGGPMHVDGDVPPVAWQSESSARTRQVAGVAAIATISLVVAALAFWWVVDRWRAENQPVAAAESTTSESGNTTAVATPGGAAKTGDAGTDGSGMDGAAGVDSGATDTTGDTTNEAGSENTEVPDSGDGIATTAAAGASGTGGPATADGKAADGETAAGVSTADGTGASPAPPPVDTTELPGDLVPSNPLFPDLTPGSRVDGTEEDDAEDLATEIPASLKRHMNVLNLGDTANVIAAGQAEAPESLEELRVLRPELTIRESDYPEPAEFADVRQLLGRTSIEALAVNERPLDEVVRTVAQVAGVPVYFDLLAMDVAGIRLDRPVSVKVGKESAGNMLRGLANLAECEMELEEGFLRIVPSGVKLGEALVSIYDVRDLEIAEATLLAGVQRLLGPVAEGASIAVEGGVLQFEADTRSRCRVALLLEAMRMAKGLPSRGDGQAIAKWVARFSEGAAGARAADWSPLPDRPVGMNEDFALPVEMILGRLARESDAALAVDWPDCWSHGLTATSSGLPWYRDRQAHQVVEQLLGPYVLVVRDTGAGVWWAGTEERYDAMRIVGILRSSADTEVTRARIAAAAGQSPEQVPAMRVPDSDQWLVYLPRYVVRELPEVLEP